MTRLRELTDHLEQIAPPDLQESYDNCGLLTGDHEQEITGVVCCLDMTPEVISEAIERGCNVVVGHHPIIFKGLRRINGYNYVERSVILAIRHGIALYAIHTSLDNVLYQGVNEQIALRLGIKNYRPLLPKQLSQAHPLQKQGNPAGTGLIGELPEPWTETGFLEHIKERMLASCVRHTALTGRAVRTVAVCGGSGSGFLPAALASGADVYVTADFKYHEFFDADGRILIADIGHYESEQFTIPLLHELITKKFSNFAAYCTGTNTNPIKYLT